MADEARGVWERYDAALVPSTLALSDALLGRVPPGGDVLDIGCGAGKNAAWIAARGAGYTGCDVNVAALAAAGRVGGARFLAADAGALPFAAAAFDAVIAQAVLTVIVGAERRTRVMAEAARVLRPGGALLLMDFVRDRATPAYRRRYAAALAGTEPGAVRYGTFPARDESTGALLYWARHSTIAELTALTRAAGLVVESVSTRPARTRSGNRATGCEIAAVKPAR